MCYELHGTAISHYTFKTRTNLPPDPWVNNFIVA